MAAPELLWLWEAIAQTADRRGDQDMTAGPALTVTAPDEPAHRAAVSGLLGRGPLRAGQSVRVDLAALTETLSIVATGLTPGAVAAHATGRRLAVKARARATRRAADTAIAGQLRAGLAAVPSHLRLDAGVVVGRLSRTGWLAKIRTHPHPDDLMSCALAVVRALPEPGGRVDRRTLVPGNPHALDQGALPSLVLSIMGVSGVKPRDAWAQLGVDIDDLLGGLIVAGVAPKGWSIPPGATLTLPPKELAGISWAQPATPGLWTLVTENPSVLSAAVESFRAMPDGPCVPRVVCTAGTPSGIACAAVGALAAAGWRVAVRADFDGKGLEHMRALLAATPSAVPWRMGAADYAAAAAAGPATGERPLRVSADATPWDPALAMAMNDAGVPAFEEDLLPQLLDDIQKGRPASVPGV